MFPKFIEWDIQFPDFFNRGMGITAKKVYNYSNHPFSNKADHKSIPTDPSFRIKKSQMNYEMFF